MPAPVRRRRRGSRPWRRSRRFPGTPASASAPMISSAEVNGSARRKPLIRSMFWMLAIAAITEPAAMNSSALKKACAISMEDAARVGADRDADDHVADLAHRRVGDDPLQVGDRERDRRRDQQRRQADEGADVGRGRRELEEREHARRSGRRPRSPWSLRGSAPRPGSGPPSRPGARCAAAAVPTWRTRRPAAGRQIAITTPSLVVKVLARGVEGLRKSKVPSSRKTKNAASTSAMSPMTLITNAFIPAPVAVARRYQKLISA